MIPLDFQELASKLIEPVHRAGARIMSYYGHAEVNIKPDSSPVTEADREADRILVAALSAIAPDTPIISEESSPDSDIDPAGTFFLVDPLDGTKEFINNRTEFTVNVALIENRKPVFGVVYAPALSAFYVTLGPDSAAKAELDPESDAPDFSSLNLKSITTRQPPAAGLTAAVSRSHMDDATRAYLEARNITDTFASGSSLKFCCIAEGLADIYPRFGRTMEWDTAAGHAVLAAAGGAVTDENGRPFLYGKKPGKFANTAFIAWAIKP